VRETKPEKSSKLFVDFRDFYSPTSKLLLRRGGPKQDPTSGVYLQKVRALGKKGWAKLPVGLGSQSTLVMHLLSFELNHLTHLIVPRISLSWSSHKMAQHGCFTQGSRLCSLVRLSPS